MDYFPNILFIEGKLRGHMEVMLIRQENHWKKCLENRSGLTFLGLLIFSFKLEFQRKLHFLIHELF